MILHSPFSSSKIRLTSENLAYPQSHSIEAPFFLFGGSFDPAHRGHFELAKTLLRLHNQAWVCWMPAIQNPLKKWQPSFTYAERWEVCQQWIHYEPRMRLVSLEQLLQTSCTYTLLRYANQFHKRPLCLVMGGDSWLNFHRWRYKERILQEASILVVQRLGISQAQVFRAPASLQFEKQYRPLYKLQKQGFPSNSWSYLPAEIMPVSSTAIREGDLRGTLAYDRSTSNSL